MSAKQWSGIMEGDESYAGSKSFYRFESAVKNITGNKFIIPTHQGRAAEKILFSVIGGEGKYIPNNTHFDTTRANVEFSGAEAVDLLVEVGKHPEQRADFKGNMDVEKMEEFIEENGAENIDAIVMTLTNNSAGGQPVSVANVKAVSEIAKKHGVIIALDDKLKVEVEKIKKEYNVSRKNYKIEKTKILNNLINHLSNIKLVSSYK